LTPAGWVRDAPLQAARPATKVTPTRARSDVERVVALNMV
jgi:hypothetical protein